MKQLAELEFELDEDNFSLDNVYYDRVCHTQFIYEMYEE